MSDPTTASQASPSSAPSASSAAPIEAATVQPSGDIPVSEAIAQFEASLRAQVPDPPGPPPAADKGIVTSPPQKATEAPPPAPTQEPAPDKDPRFGRAYERLAAREASLQARERELAEKMAAAPQSAQKDLLAKFKANPIRFLREAGADDEQISTLGRAALGATLKDAPQQYRDLAERFSLSSQNEDLRSDFEKFRKEIADERVNSQREAQNERYRQEYRNAVTQYVTSPELEKSAPTVSRLHAADPEETMRRLSDVVARDAQAKMRTGHGEPLSPQEAVAALERELAPFARAFAPSAAPASAPTTTARDTQTPARKNLSDSVVTTTPTNRQELDPEKDWEGWKREQEAAWLAELSRKSQ